MKKKKIVLAYSGGLDTSIILKWLQENYSAEVVAYTADIGQKINKKKIINNAKKLGVKRIIIENLKDSSFSKEIIESVFADRYSTWHGVASAAFLIECLLGIFLVLKIR